MTALGTPAQPTVEVEFGNEEYVAWTQVANADTFVINVYENVAAPGDTLRAALAKTVTRVAGTGATKELLNTGLKAGTKYEVTVKAHDSTAAFTDSAESTKSAEFTTKGAKTPAVGTQAAIAHRTTNEFTGAAYASAGQTKGQVTYVRNGDGTISQTTVDATTSVGSTAAARDTADMASGVMQKTEARDEGDAQAGEGLGKTLIGDLVVTPTSLTANNSVVVNPVTKAMTAITGTSDTPREFDGTGVKQDRTLHEIDHLKAYVDKGGVAH